MPNQLVLIADDETHILSVVSLKLRSAGYRVLTARTGREALNLAHQHRPDLVITDFHMPELSGLELCREMRGSADTCNIPVVMLTARGYTLVPADTRDLGIVRMFSKPFSPRKLLASIVEVLEGRPRVAA